MVIPQVRDQVKRAPTLALRAMFAGIGRILMAADRPQATGTGPAASRGGGDQPAPAAARMRPQAHPAAGAVPCPRWRSLDQTGNVRLLSADDLGDGAVLPPSGPAVSRPTVSEPAASGPALPLANYDQLSLASIRARLRSLDARQLRVLIEHERRNAERPEVLGMLERRIDKIEAGG
jgi:hypothetical protein